MRRFEITDDGLVVVRDGAAVYIDTPENFAADSGLAAPDEPGLLYIAGLPVVSPQRQSVPAENPAFDAVIAQVGQLLAAQAARQAAAAAAAEAARSPDDKMNLDLIARGVTAYKVALALLMSDEAALTSMRSAVTAAKDARK